MFASGTDILVHFLLLGWHGYKFYIVNLEQAWKAVYYKGSLALKSAKSFFTSNAQIVTLRFARAKQESRIIGQTLVKTPVIKPTPWSRQG